MLSYLVFGFSCVVGLAIILFFLYRNNNSREDEKRAKTTTGSGKQLRTEDIPGWTNEPADERLGDTGVMAKHGSLHQYLVHRHKREGPIIAFWMPGPEHVISIASPGLFRDTAKLFDRLECIFELVRPLITSESIQFANYEDGNTKLLPCCAEEFLAKYDNPEARERVSLQENCFSLSIKSICRTSLGDIFSDEEEVKAISDAYHKCWDEIGSRLGGDFPEKGSAREQQFLRDKDVFYKIVKRIIDARKNSSDTSKDLPFIDALLSAQLPEETTQADVVTYLIGGFHNSAYFMVWSLYYLGTHPEVQEKVYKEIVSVIGEGEVTFDAVKGMSYLRQVQEEVLRLSNLAPFAARFSQEDITVGGYPIPAMTPIIHALGVVSEDEKIWSNPEVFDPDRFTPEEAAKREPISFVPFGLGRRICPGVTFSYIEVATFLAIFLRKYYVAMVTTKPAEKVRGLTDRPKEEIFVKLTLRKK